MNPLPYEQAFERIRAEYLEMPGMRLTPEQVRRLSGIDSSVCRVVLDDLVRAKFLRRAPDGSYARWFDEGASQHHLASAGSSSGAVRSA
jgi:hypothetical protein